MKSAELERALHAASDGGRLPIVFDTSPCAYRMKRYLAGRLDVRDSIEFVHDTVLPRVTLAQRPEAVAIHPVCSVRKMGTVDKLTGIAARCSADVVCVDEVTCCGFAGDKGFNRPELNEHALAAPEVRAAGQLPIRLLVQPHLRNRPVGIRADSLPVDPLSGRRLRESADRRQIATLETS